MTYLKGPQYHDTKKGIFRNRNIINIESMGNCCWNVFDIHGFRGNSVAVYPGFNEMVAVQPGSIKNVPC